MYCKRVYYMYKFLCKVDHNTDKFTHAPMYTYNEGMWLLELANIVEQ